MKASPSQDDPTSGASTDSGSPAAAVFAAIAVAAVDASAAIAAFVAGAAALPAVVSRHSHAVGSGADVPDPAFAGVSAVPVPASRIPFPAAAGTSGPALGCLYLEHWVAPRGKGREDGRACWVEQRCCSLRYCSAVCCSPDAADSRHD